MFTHTADNVTQHAPTPLNDGCSDQDFMSFLQRSKRQGRSLCYLVALREMDAASEEKGIDASEKVWAKKVQYKRYTYVRLFMTK